MKKILVLFLFFGIGITSYAQPKHRICGVASNLEHLSKENPKIYETLEQSRIKLKYQQQLRQRIPATLRQQKRTIRVVVHVVYNNDDENISNEQIYSQIRVLNEDFRKMENTNGNNTHPHGADTFIQFSLAQIDPEGNSTSGITRTETNKTSFSFNNQIKYDNTGGKSAWDTTRYLNIWVGNLSGGLLGYAQFPETGNQSTDGVVIRNTAFGDMGYVREPFNLGRTTTHEVGHWLGLRHIWGDGGCSADDGISDTPRSDRPNYGKPQHPLVHCASDDMFENYMDYTDDGAMNIFTKGQSEFMNATLDSVRMNVLK